MTVNPNKSEVPVHFSIDHTAISVSNLDVSVHFYTEILGFTCERIIDIPDNAGRIALLKKSDFTIEMFGFNNAQLFLDNDNLPENDLKKIGVKHIALRVMDIWAAARFLEEQGVEFINEPVQGARGFYRFFVKDPDGLPLEFTEGPDTMEPPGNTPIQ